MLLRVTYLVGMFLLYSVDLKMLPREVETTNLFITDASISISAVYIYGKIDRDTLGELLNNNPS